MFGQSNVYAIYRRKLSSDKYEANPYFSCIRDGDNADADALGYFKHEVYAFALHRYGDTIKSIYLYRNGWRVGRATFVDGEKRRLLLTFNNAATRGKFERHEERLPAGEWPLRERRFHRRFDVVHTLAAHEASFQRK